MILEELFVAAKEKYMKVVKYAVVFICGDVLCLVLCIVFTCGNDKGGAAPEIRRELKIIYAGVGQVQGGVESAIDYNQGARDDNQRAEDQIRLARDGLTRIENSADKLEALDRERADIIRRLREKERD